MTDPTPPTDLGEIIVTGQRRSSPASSFPGGGGKGGTSDEQLEVGEDPDAGGGEHSNPQCADPEARRIWNADAAAAASVDEFLNRAGLLGESPPLGIREFGAPLILGGNGAVNLGPVEWSAPGIPGQTISLQLDYTGVSGSNYMGDIHSHPSGNGLPSQADMDSFNYWLDQAEAAGRNVDNITMYIVVEDTSTNPATRTIYAYQRGDAPINLAMR